MTDTARILATDDQREVLRLIERTLGRRYEVELAQDLEAARAALERTRFDLALCDVRMPGESGLVLVEEIVRELPETAVVLVTVADDPSDAERAFELGAHGYLVKPFWPGQLLITTMSALRRRDLEIAERSRARTLQERLTTMMDRAPVPMYVKDRDRRYVVANRAAHESVGLPPGEMVGLTDDAFLAPVSQRTVRETDLHILERGGTFKGEVTLSVNGDRRTLLSVKYPFVDERGEIVGISGVSTDVTAKEEAESLRSDLATAQEKAIEELRSSRQETVERLSRAIESHDPETGAHVERMARIASYLGSEVGLSEDKCLLLRAAAPMHDVGKIAIPDQILRKPGRLTSEERSEMERHTLVGYEILTGSESELLQMAARVALTHHERFDGGGYPQGLGGSTIPIEGRIVAVADVFDALLSDRAYRAAMSLQEAVAVIREGRGSHFDPEVADALLDHLEEAVAMRS